MHDGSARCCVLGALCSQTWGHAAHEPCTAGSPVQELGQYVDEVVDYTKEDFSEKYANAPFDVIVDSVTGAGARLSCTVIPSLLACVCAW